MATSNWIGLTNDLWDVETNWFPIGVPNDTSTSVVLDYTLTTGPYSVTIQATDPNYAIASLTLGSSMATEGVELSNAGSLTLATGTSTLYAGTEIHNTGSIFGAGSIDDYGLIDNELNLTVADTLIIENGGSLLIGQPGSVDVQTQLADGGQITVHGSLTVDQLSGNGSFIVDGGASIVDASVDSATSTVAFTIENGGGLQLGNVSDATDTFVFGRVTTQQNLLLLPNLVGAFGAEITNFGPGDVIYLGIGGSPSVTANGNGSYTLSVGDVSLDNVFLAANATSGQVQFSDEAFVVACFAEGTLIRTATGEVAVEALATGDVAVTLSGAHAPIEWIGRRRLTLTRHPDPESVTPVRIRAHAIADSVPARDLLVSPDHALYLEGVLIQARQLVNGSSIVQDFSRDSVTYFHVELPRHDILLAENTPAESYLEAANRGWFANAAGVQPLRPMQNCAGRGTPERHTGGCAPLVVDAATVEPVWRRIADRSDHPRFGGAVKLPQTTADAKLRVVIGNRTLRPVRFRDRVATFVLPRGVERIMLTSLAARPSETRPWLDDRRCLGVPVAALRLGCGNERRDLPIDHPALTSGWWDVERTCGTVHRWTNGSALIEIAKLMTAAVLDVHLAGDTAHPLERVRCKLHAA